MEKSISFSNWVLLILFLVIPIIMFLFLEFSRKKSIKNMVKICGILLILILPIASGWWTDKSTEILLIHYKAYNFNNEFDQYIFSTENVKPENLKRVEQLYSRHMGIGWPLKVIMTSIFYFPLILIIYSVQLIIIEYLRKRNYFSNT